MLTTSRLASVIIWTWGQILHKLWVSIRLTFSLNDRSGTAMWMSITEAPRLSFPNCKKQRVFFFPCETQEQEKEIGYTKSISWQQFKTAMKEIKVLKSVFGSKFLEKESRDPCHFFYLPDLPVTVTEVSLSAFGTHSLNQQRGGIIMRW